MTTLELYRDPARDHHLGAFLYRATFRSFWTIQAFGWVAYLVVHFLGALADGEPLSIFWASLTSAVAGFVLTSAMRPILVRLWERPAPLVAGIALGLSLVFAVPFSAASELSYWLATGEGWRLDAPVTYLGSAFWCGTILLTWTGIYFGLEYYRQAQDQKQALLKAEADAHEARLEALRYQLNPHFLFNTLNGISTLILDEDKDRAIAMLDRLCRLLRETLEGNPSGKIPLRQELELARTYLAIEQVRFEERLKVAFRIAPEAQEVPVPRLMLQPLIENAVKHGVANCSGPATIHVSAQVENGRLKLSVRDDGSGPGSGSDRAGIGHQNTRERLETLYGERHRFEFRRLAEGGAEVVVELPVEPA